MPDTRKILAPGVALSGFTAGLQKLNDNKQSDFGRYNCHVTIDGFDQVKQGRKIRTFHVSFYLDGVRSGQTFWVYAQATNTYVVAPGAWGVCAGPASAPYLVKAWNIAKSRKFSGNVPINSPAPAAVAPAAAPPPPAGVPGAAPIAAAAGPIVVLAVAPAPAVVAAPPADNDGGA